MSEKSIQHVSELEEYLALIKGPACLVKFTAAWCGPCRKINPTFHRLADEHIEHFKVFLTIIAFIKNQRYIGQPI